MRTPVPGWGAASLLLLSAFVSRCSCGLNLTAAAAQAHQLSKEANNNNGFFFTNIGPNSFEYRGMFAPGQAPVDFHKNFQALFDKFSEGLDYPKPLQPKPSPAPQPFSNPPSPVYNPPSPVYNPPSPVYNPPSPVYNPPSPVYTPPSPVYTPPPPKAPAYVPQDPVYNPPAPVYQRQPPTRAPQVLPKYDLYRIRPTVPPNINNVPVQPFVNHVQPYVDQPYVPLVNPVQPFINTVHHQYQRIEHNTGQPVSNPEQPLINPIQLHQPNYRGPVPTIAPRIEHNAEQPYLNPEQQPFQFPVNFPEYHLVRGQTRAESYPKIFRFTDGRINIVDFERKKKKRQGKRVQFGDGLDPDLVNRDQFLILHGGYYPGEQSNNANSKYNDKVSNNVYYDNINDVQDIQKLAPNLEYFYQK